MSTYPAVDDDRLSPAETLGGFLAAAAIFVGAMTILNLHLSIAGVTIAFRPVKTGLAAEIVALVSAALAPKSRLTMVAAGFCTFAWFASMVVAVVTNRPLF
jgi:hypothetical protein